MNLGFSQSLYMVARKKEQCPLRAKIGKEIGDELARPKPAVEVQQCPLRAEIGENIGDELARPKPAVEVQQCPLRAEVGEKIGEEIGEELAWQGGSGRGN